MELLLSASGVDRRPKDSRQGLLVPLNFAALLSYVPAPSPDTIARQRHSTKYLTSMLKHFLLAKMTLPVSARDANHWDRCRFTPVTDRSNAWSRAEPTRDSSP